MDRSGAARPCRNDQWSGGSGDVAIQARNPDTVTPQPQMLNEATPQRRSGNWYLFECFFIACTLPDPTGCAPSSNPAAALRLCLEARLSSTVSISRTGSSIQMDEFALRQPMFYRNSLMFRDQGYGVSGLRDEQDRFRVFDCRVAVNTRYGDTPYRAFNICKHFAVPRQSPDVSRHDTVKRQPETINAAARTKPNHPNGCRCFQ